MADVDTPPMHEDFARWYGAVSLGGDQPRPQARWEGVSNIVRDADRNTVEGLLRLAHRSPQAPAAAVVKTVRQAFKATDEAFEMSGNDRELQILAGVCLTVLMETNKDVGAVAALSVTTAGLGGARRPDLPMDLPALGETAINRCGEINRRRPSITADLSGEPPQVDFEEAATALIEEESSESFAAVFKLVADTTFSAIQQFAKTQASAVDRFLRIQDEELQMLWWLIGQRSSEYDCAFDAIPTDARPLVLASELAHNTQFLPGPPSVMGILSRAGLKEHQDVQIAAAAGEAFRQMWEGRDCEPAIAEILRCGDVLLFVHADTIRAPSWIVDEVALSIAAGIERPGGQTKAWDPRLSPTQVQLVDLLQLFRMPPLDVGPRRLAIVLSAWDTVRDEGLTPIDFLRSRLPLLNQYLRRGADDWTWRIYGLSAQGGTYDKLEDSAERVPEAEELRKLDRPSKRIQLVGPVAETHDLTEPLAWLMD